MTTRTPSHPLLGEAAVRARLASRYRRERLFRGVCLLAVVIAVSFLVLLFSDIARKGWGAFVQTHVRFEVFFDPSIIDPTGTRDPANLQHADYAKLWREPLKATVREGSGRKARREMYGLMY